MRESEKDQLKELEKKWIRKLSSDFVNPRIAVKCLTPNMRNFLNGGNCKNEILALCKNKVLNPINIMILIPFFFVHAIKALELKNNINFKGEKIPTKRV